MNDLPAYIAARSAAGRLIQSVIRVILWKITAVEVVGYLQFTYKKMLKSEMVEDFSVLKID